MRQIPVNCVKEGTILAKTIYNSSGNVLLKEGVYLYNPLLKRIEENGILTLYISDSYSDTVIEDIIKPEIREKAIKTVRETFNHIIHSNIALEKETSDFKQKLQIKGMQKYLKTLKSLSDTIIDDITSKKNVMINLVDIKNIDSYTYDHSLNVGVLSIILGIELKLDKVHLQALFIGSLLHDIGKAFIPQEIINKKEKHNIEEETYLKTHTTKGYDYIKENYGLDANSKVIVLQHHENFDGTGYPKGTSGGHINRLARIVAITNAYDQLTSDTPNTRAVPANEAIEYLMAGAGRSFDFDMVSLFVKKIVPYPIGTLVKLSNGLIAVIKDIPPNYPLRPQVRYVERGTGKIFPHVIDLMKEKNIIITGVQHIDPKDM